MSETAACYMGQTGVLSPALYVAERLDDIDLTRCYYCGETADSVDHVVPQSMLRTLSTLEDEYTSAILARHGRRMTVPACIECNVLLGNKYFITLAERKAHLKQRLRVRYRKLLATPDWTDTELGRLGDRMQGYVIASVVKRDIVLKRIRY